MKYLNDKLTILLEHEQEGFLAAISSDPHDWGPKLMYADWLEERGDPVAPLIRMFYEFAEALRNANMSNIDSLNRAEDWSIRLDQVISYQLDDEMTASLFAALDKEAEVLFNEVLRFDNSMDAFLHFRAGPTPREVADLYYDRSVNTASGKLVPSFYDALNTVGLFLRRSNSEPSEGDIDHGYRSFYGF